jgi:hypothetical protein
MSFETEHIILTFLILVLAIGTGYFLNISREGFDAIATTTPQTTLPITTVSSETVPQTTASNTLSAAIKEQISGLTDSSIQDTVQTQLDNLQSLVNRYATLDIPIIMNDSGQICSVWGDYANGRYRQQQNQCIALDDDNTPKCLGTDGNINPCGNILADGFINTKSNINYQSLINSAASNVINAIPNITSQIDKMDQQVNSIITSITDRGSIQLQQNDIITNNNENMVYKNKLMNDNAEKLNKKQNDTNINQNKFSSFISYITDVNSTTNIYYKIIIGLIITIIIMGILNFLFSNILS